MKVENIWFWGWQAESVFVQITLKYSLASLLGGLLSLRDDLWPLPLLSTLLLWLVKVADLWGNFLSVCDNSCSVCMVIAECCLGTDWSVLSLLLSDWLECLCCDWSMLCVLCRDWSVRVWGSAYKWEWLRAIIAMRASNESSPEACKNVHDRKMWCTILQNKITLKLKTWYMIHKSIHKQQCFDYCIIVQSFVNVGTDC